MHNFFEKWARNMCILPLERKKFLCHIRKLLLNITLRLQKLSLNMKIIWFQVKILAHFIVLLTRMLVLNRLLAHYKMKTAWPLTIQSVKRNHCNVPLSLLYFWQWQPVLYYKDFSQFYRVYFSFSLIHWAIKSLETKTKGGPDGVPSIIFINCCDELSYQISKKVLTTESFQQYGSISKKSNVADSTYYRPISLTVTLRKMTEVLTKDHLVRLLVDKGIIN